MDMSRHDGLEQIAIVNVNVPTRRAHRRVRVAEEMHGMKRRLQLPNPVVPISHGPCAACVRLSTECMIRAKKKNVDDQGSLKNCGAVIDSAIGQPDQNHMRFSKSETEGKSAEP